MSKVNIPTSVVDLICDKNSRHIVIKGVLEYYENKNHNKEGNGYLELSKCKFLKQISKNMQDYRKELELYNIKLTKYKDGKYYYNCYSKKAYSFITVDSEIISKLYNMRKECTVFYLTIVNMYSQYSRSYYNYTLQSILIELKDKVGHLRINQTKFELLSKGIFNIEWRFTSNCFKYSDIYDTNGSLIYNENNEHLEIIPIIKNLVYHNSYISEWGLEVYNDLDYYDIVRLVNQTTNHLDSHKHLGFLRNSEFKVTTNFKQKLFNLIENEYLEYNDLIYVIKNLNSK